MNIQDAYPDIEWRSGSPFQPSLSFENPSGAMFEEGSFSSLNEEKSIALPKGEFAKEGESAPPFSDEKSPEEETPQPIAPKDQPKSGPRSRRRITRQTEMVDQPPSDE